MPSDTRQRLVDAATRRFRRDGFRNVGLDAILDDVDITKTAFYKHFQSKDDLMVEVLDGQGAWFKSQFLDVLRTHGGPSATGQLRALLDAVEQIMESPDFHGCVFVQASMEFPNPNDPAHQAAVRNKRALQTLIHDIGERAGCADPQQLAAELAMVIEGAYVTRLLTGRPDTIQIARRLAERVIDGALPALRSVSKVDEGTQKIRG
jgi:AcrR family transcriptional regulator